MAFTWNNKPTNAGQISVNTILEIRQNLDSLNNSYSCTSANGTVVCNATAGDCNVTTSCNVTAGNCNVTNSSQYIPDDGYCAWQDASQLHSENSSNNNFDDSSLCSFDDSTKDRTNYWND